METSIKYNEVPLIVNFIYEGRYFAATRETPEELPTINILKITVEDSDIDISPLLDWRDIEQIEEIINSNQ